MSHEDFVSLHREYVARQREYFDCYKDPEKAFRLEYSLMVSMDVRNPVPTDQLANLKAQGNFLHNHQLTTASWDTLDDQIGIWFKHRKEDARSLISPFHLLSIVTCRSAIVSGWQSDVTNREEARRHLKTTATLSVISSRRSCTVVEQIAEGDKVMTRFE